MGKRNEAMETRNGGAQQGAEAAGKLGKTRRATARSVAIADAGIKTSDDFTRCFSLLIGDIASGRIDVKEANAMCNAGGRVLKSVEMKHKYGRSKSISTPMERKVLDLTSSNRSELLP